MDVTFRIGCVGALAVALGFGIAVAATRPQRPPSQIRLRHNRIRRHRALSTKRRRPRTPKVARAMIVRPRPTHPRAERRTVGRLRGRHDQARPLRPRCPREPSGPGRVSRKPRRPGRTRNPSRRGPLVTQHRTRHDPDGRPMTAHHASRRTLPPAMTPSKQPYLLLLRPALRSPRYRSPRTRRRPQRLLANW